MSTVLNQEVRRIEPLATLFDPQTIPGAELPLEAIDFLELYVGNARQAAYFYRIAMGMRLVAYAGPETGSHYQTSFVLQQGSIRLVLTTPLRPDNEAAAHIHRHGDGVRDVAFRVLDARAAWLETTRRGARNAHEPDQLQSGERTARISAIATFGDTIHSFVERAENHEAHLPGFWPIASDPLAQPTGLYEIDSLTIGVNRGRTAHWADLYMRILGFRPEAEASGDLGAASPGATLVKEMPHRRHPFRLMIREPEVRHENDTHTAKTSSPLDVEQYLEYYHGAGVQRIALATDDILFTAAALNRRGVDFLPAPAQAKETPGHDGLAGLIEEPLSELDRYGITAAREPGGYRLACCTRPVEDRPTLLFEIVQHKPSAHRRQ